MITVGGKQQADSQCIKYTDSELVKYIKDERGRYPEDSPLIDVIRSVREATGVCERIDAWSEPIEGFCDPNHIRVHGYFHADSDTPTDQLVEQARQIADIQSGEIVGLHGTEGENASSIVEEGFATTGEDGTIRDGKAFFWIEPKYADLPRPDTNAYLVATMPMDSVYVSHFAVAFEIGDLLSNEEYVEHHTVTAREYIQCKAVLEKSRFFGFEL